MPPPIVIPLLVTGLSIAAGAMMSFLRAEANELQGRRFLRELQHGRRRPCSGLVHGEVVAVVGTVEPVDRAVTAPLTGRRGVAWDASVWAPLGASGWSRAALVGEHVAFALRDATGRVHVQADRIQCYGAVDYEETIVPGQVPATVARFLAAHRLDGLIGTRRLVLKESVLSPGERAVVVGLVHHPEADEGRSTYRGSALLSERTLVARGGAPILVSDAPEAIDPTSRR